MFFASQKTVLNTRPVGQHERLDQLLLFSGFQSLHLPLLEIAAFKETVTMPTQIWNSVIFTSANAVHHYLLQHRALPKANDYLCIGAATADLLKELGKVKVLYPNTPDSESMLAMPALQNGQDKRILLITGVGGRDLLEQSLRERGAELLRINVYERRIPDYSSQQVKNALEQCASIVITSGDSLKNLLKLTPPECQSLLRSRLLATISPRIQDIAFLLGFQDVITGALTDIPQKIKNHLQGRHHD